MQRKLVLFIACSVDGYIAGTDGNIDFLNLVHKPGEDYGYADFMDTVDTILVGRKTYDHILSMGVEIPYPDKTVYVVTRTPREASGLVRYYSGSLTALVQDLKSQSGKNIFCDGGATVVHELLKNNLIDEFYISIIPVLLGDGIRLFQDGRSECRLALTDTQTYETGLVRLHYTNLVQ